MKACIHRSWAAAGLLIGAVMTFAGCQADHQEAVQPDRPDFADPIASCACTTAPERIQDDYWRSQFERVNAEVAAAKGCQLVFFGDSITMDWTLLRGHGKAVWEERFAKFNPINMGNSGDITPVMLYRVTHGNLDFPEGDAPKVAVMLCGTNNYVVTKSDEGREHWDLGINTPPADVAEGVRAVAQAFRRELPSTKLIILGILPCKQPEKWAKCQETNRVLAGFSYPRNEVVFLDLADCFTNADGSLKAELYTDGTHLTPAGYVVMADAIEPVIKRLMGGGD